MLSPRMMSVRSIQQIAFTLSITEIFASPDDADFALTSTYSQIFSVVCTCVACGNCRRQSFVPRELFNASAQALLADGLPLRLTH